MNVRSITRFAAVLCALFVVSAVNGQPALRSFTQLQNRELRGAFCTLADARRVADSIARAITPSIIAIEAPADSVFGSLTPDPLSTWKKTVAVQAQTTTSTSGNIGLMAWIHALSFEPSKTLHAIVGEVYVPSAVEDTMAYYSMVQENSFNVAGVIRQTSSTPYFYNTILNGKPTVVGNDTGLIDVPYLIYLDINPLDVPAGLWPYCQVDQLYGIRIQHQDNPSIPTYSLWAGDDIFGNAWMLVRNGIIVGAGTSDSGRITSDSLINFEYIISKPGGTTIFDTRNNGSQGSALRLWSDSGQIRLITTAGGVYLQVADSAFAANLPFFIAGFNSTNMPDFHVRADTSHFRGTGVFDSGLVVGSSVIRPDTALHRLAATHVFARETAPASDSVVLSKYGGYWMVSDSGYGTGTEPDSFSVGGYVPYAFNGDSIAFSYITTSAAAIDSLGGRHGSGTGLAIDSVRTPIDVNLTATSAAYVAYALDRNFVAGQGWAINFKTALPAGKTIKILGAWIIGRPN